MPKIKTHKATQRRFRFTASGKILRAKGAKSHLRRRKSDRAKRLFSKMILAHPSFRVRVKRLMPYGSREAKSVGRQPCRGLRVGR